MEIGILVFPDVEELDFAGPWEILGAWAEHHPQDGARLRLVAEDGEPVRCRKGLQVVPDATLDEAGRLDVVLVPGGQGTRALLSRTDLHDWLRDQAASGALVTSVCTGSLVLAAAGLLDGRRAATHWSAYDELREAGRGAVEVVEDERFVDEGPVVTAAGVSAGIDMALHLVARLASPDTARAVRREVQYDPEPPV
jgi:transcriptional regulator GlxA family with amidase domain